MLTRFYWCLGIGFLICVLLFGMGTVAMKWVAGYMEPIRTEPDMHNIVQRTHISLPHDTVLLNSLLLDYRNQRELYVRLQMSPASAKSLLKSLPQGRALSDDEQRSIMNNPRVPWWNPRKCTKLRVMAFDGAPFQCNTYVIAGFDDPRHAIIYVMHCDG